MKFGIIAEGKSDQAVLTNILKGQLGIDTTDIDYLQPENYLDETDLNSPKYKMTKDKYSNWELVKNECISKEKILPFFDNPIDEQRFLIIQIDTAETHLINYDIKKPDKKNNANYSSDLIKLVSDRIDQWIGITTYNIIYAICIEETDAWVLTIYTDNNNDTSSFNDPKYQLNDVFLPKKFKTLKLKEINEKDASNRCDELTKDFRKKKELKKLALKNYSLKHFCSLLDNLK